MKSAWALVFLAICAVLVVAFQVIKQEVNIRKMRKILIFNTAEIKSKEDEILTSKDIMQKLSSQLDPVDKQRKELTTKLEELVNLKEKTEQNLNTCQTQKAEVEQQKAQKASTFNEQRTSQNAEILKLQEEAQSLQKQILDRDTKICVYVDKEQDEGRTLCKDKMAASNA